MTVFSGHRHTLRVLTARVAVSEEHAQTLPRGPGTSARPGPAHSDLAERGAWSLVWLAVLTGGIDLWGFWWWSPFAVVLAPLLVLVGIGGTASCWVARSPRALRFQLPAFVSVMVTMLFPAAILINTRLYYTTDSAAFDQVATRALLRGVDPYVTSMSSAARLLQDPARFWTYTVTGGHVSHFSYPAGSFLLDAPAMLLGFHHMVVDWMDLFCWIVTSVMLFVLLPTSLRWLAALVSLTPVLLGTFTSGGTDAMFLPFLVLAVWRWDRYGQGRQAGVARWMGPIALGLACTIKQTPWFCVPMLATGIFLEARRTSRPAVALVTRYLATVLGVFVVVNGPFIIWQPRAWAHGTLIPLLGGLVADGQGLVALAIHGVTGGVDLTMLSVAGALATLTAIAAFALWYPHLKRVWLVLVTIPLFLSPRSLSSYLVDLFPAAVVAAVSVGNAPRWVPLAARSRVEQGARFERVKHVVGWPALAVALGGLATIVVSILAFAGPPLAMSVRSVTTSHRGTQLDAVTVFVRNRTDHTVTPHFMVNAGANPNGFWMPAHNRPVVIGPDGSAVVSLRASTFTFTPQKGARWLVEAYTVGPTWLSTSALEPFPLHH